MFENLLALLERGVVALEQIAVNTAPPSWVKEQGCGCRSTAATVEDTNYLEPTIAETEVIDPPEEHPSVQEIAEADAAYLEREFVKTQLREKGIKFKESARTETLKKLLDAPVVVAPVVEEVVAPATYTDADVRIALTNLAAAKGKDVALNILKNVGGSAALRDVPPSKYSAIVEACHGA